ncbi:MAG TPA: molybdenum cofactor biosynthesis protein MoaE [Virgibacillus sp.]|nr:molybdenum cofactor biosynthesis protein MoaE [Virgibacillus sp.]
MTKPLFEVIEEPIQVEEVLNKVKRREAGANALFIGTVREWTEGRKTLHLKYEAYVPMAVKMLEEIGKEIQAEWTQSKVAITHRIGHLDITDAAVVIAVSTPHRKASYEANEYAIERIKQIVPIWKKEHYEDGETWIGDQLENVPYESGRPHMEGD